MFFEKRMGESLNTENINQIKFEGCGGPGSDHGGDCRATAGDEWGWSVNVWGRTFTLPRWSELPTRGELALLTNDLFHWILKEAERFGELTNFYAKPVEDDFTGEVIRGVIGDEEISNKVRLSAINGIYCPYDETIEMWGDVSKLFKSKVHYVYNETKGTFVTDGTHALWDKYVRMNPKTITALARHWESLLDEMDDDGMIYHIAHSHGALLTSQAADLVSSEVRRRLIIRTFGAFQSPHQKDIADLKNIVCPDDPVIWLNHYREGPDVIRVPGVKNPVTPLEDAEMFIRQNHSLTEGPYWEYLSRIESYNFRERYEGTYTKWYNWFDTLWNGPKAVTTVG
jgi:hypothetical protein